MQTSSHTVVICDLSSEPFHCIRRPRDYFIGSGNQGQGHMCVYVCAKVEGVVEAVNIRLYPGD